MIDGEADTILSAIGRTTSPHPAPPTSLAERKNRSAAFDLALIRAIRVKPRVLAFWRFIHLSHLCLSVAEILHFTGSKTTPMNRMDWVWLSSITKKNGRSTIISNGSKGRKIAVARTIPTVTAAASVPSSFTST